MDNITNQLLDRFYDGILLRLPDWQPTTRSPETQWNEYLKNLSLFGRLPSWNSGAQAVLAHHDCQLQPATFLRSIDKSSERSNPNHMQEAAVALVGSVTGGSWADGSPNHIVLYKDDQKALVRWSLFEPKTTGVPPEELEYCFYVYGTSINNLKIYGYTIAGQEGIQPLSQFSVGVNRYPILGERLGINERLMGEWCQARWKRGRIWTCSNEIIWNLFSDREPDIDLDSTVDFEDQIGTIFNEDQAVITITPWAEDMKLWFPQGLHIEYNNSLFELK